MNTKIAIYSGEIPSTSFVERLIEGIAEDEYQILLFGNIKRKKNYNRGNVLIVGNRRDGWGIWIAVFRIIKLKVMAPLRFQKLKNHLGFGAFDSKKGFMAWQKYVPVVLHLPDIFHLQWAKAADEWLFLKEQFGVKLVVSLRGAHINYSPLADDALAEIYQNVLPQYDAFHAVSHAILKEGVRYGVDVGKSKVIYSGLHPLSLDNVKKESGEVKLLSVGRFHWKKGYHYLLDAFVLVRKIFPDAKLTLIAPGNIPEELLVQMHDLKLENAVDWIRGLPVDQVMAQMKLHNVLVLPSVEEGIANVVLEAMNVGLPVISTDCGGMNEVIEHKVNGWLVPVRDPVALAAGIVEVMDLTPEDREKVCANANQTIREKFHTGKSRTDFVNLYQSVLS